jgi:hypothetical protein
MEGTLCRVGSALVFAWVPCAIVRRKPLVAMRLKVPFHLLVILALRRVRRAEDPSTLRTAPTMNVRLVYPHHLADGGERGVMLCSGRHVV